MVHKVGEHRDALRFAVLSVALAEHPLRTRLMHGLAEHELSGRSGGKISPHAR